MEIFCQIEVCGGGQDPAELQKSDKKLNYNGYRGSGGALSSSKIRESIA